MTRAAVGWRLVWVVAVVATAAVAQDEFARAYSHAERLRATGAADEAAVRAAYAEALRRFAAAPDAVRRDPRWLPAAAFCAFRAGDASRAVALFETSMEAGNRDAFHVEYLLWSLLRDAQHEEFLRRARRWEPEFEAAVRAVLGEGGGLVAARAWEVADRWLRAGERDAGLWVFRALVRAFPGDATTQANLGLALRNVGDLEAAEAQYRRALEIAPDDPQIWNDLGLLHKGAGQWVAAAAALGRSRAAESAPPTGPATTNLGLLALGGGPRRLSDPAAALARVVAARPTAALARHAYLGAILSEFRRAAAHPTRPSAAVLPTPLVGLGGRAKLANPGHSGASFAARVPLLAPAALPR